MDAIVKSPSTSVKAGKVKLPKSPFMDKAPLILVKESSSTSCKLELLNTRNSPLTVVKLFMDKAVNSSLANTCMDAPTVFKLSNAADSKLLYANTNEPLTASKEEIDTDDTSWMVKLEAQIKFSNLTTAWSLLNDKVKPSVTVSNPDKSMDEMFLLLLTFKTPMVLKSSKLSMDWTAVSDKVSDVTLAKPAFKLSTASAGKEIKDNSLALVNFVKSMVTNWVKASKDKDPVMLAKVAKLTDVMELELNTVTSPLMVETPLKSKAATASPVISMVPSKVGHEFKARTAVAAVMVVESEHESEDRAAVARRAKRAMTRGLNNII